MSPGGTIEAEHAVRLGRVVSDRARPTLPVRFYLDTRGAAVAVGAIKSARSFS